MTHDGWRMRVAGEDPTRVPHPTSAHRHLRIHRFRFAIRHPSFAICHRDRGHPTMPQPSSLTPQLLATAAILAWGLSPAGEASGMPSRVRETLRCDLLSRADYERMERGYY